MASMDVWTYQQTSWTQTDLTGFEVEAIDGSIGKVDESTNATDSSYVVVDTGPWIFGKKVMLPAGVVRDVDPDAQTVFVNRTKDQIKNAPEFDEQTYRDTTYRDELAAYYGPESPTDGHDPGRAPSGPTPSPGGPEYGPGGSDHPDPNYP
jgi:hypothetical protein